MKNNPFKKQFYLAGPYSHKNIKVQDKRFKVLTKVASCLTIQGFEYGFRVFSPITHSHPISIVKVEKDWYVADYYKKLGFAEGDWDTYEQIDYAYLDECLALIVLTIEGWKESKGVTAEIKYAESKNMKVFYSTPAQIFNGELVNTLNLKYNLKNYK